LNRWSSTHGSLAALSAGILGLGFSPVLVRLSEIGPSATAVQRVALALPVLGLWMLQERAGIRNLRTLSRHDWLLLALAGLFWTGDLIAWHWALRLTTIANANLLTMTAPVLVTFAAWLLFGERITAGFLIGLAVALIGAMPLVATSLDLGSGHLLGDGIAVTAAACFAGYLLAVKQLRGALPTGTIMFITCLFSLPGLLLAAALSNEPLAAGSLHGWLILLALALSAQAFGQGLIALAMARLPASFTSVSLLVQPVLAILLGWAILGEAATPAQVLGGAIVLVGIVISRRYGAKPVAPPGEVAPV
jgi:drug/metabolite transporter (DMT)-like permease